MGKTLVIAEKPSVGRDLAGALPDSFTASKDKTHIEGDNYVITWAIGHLVGLAQPDEYDEKLKKWRYADLPIVPKKFKLVPNDDKSKKQLSVIHRFLRSDDIDSVVNACDAGREGELIFAYVYETGKVKKPVKRLWLSSMTRKAIQEAFERLRDGEEMQPLEAAARSRSEADWIVGMNATRAASIRLRAAFDGAVSLGRVQTPTLALVARREVEIRNFKPEPYWLVEAKFEATGDRRYDGRYLGGKRIAEDLAAEIVEACRDKQGEITKLETKEERERSQLLYDLTSLQRHANTLYGFSARRTLAAAQKLYEQHKAITYPRTNSRWLSGDLVAEIRPTAELVGKNAQYAKGAAYVTSLKELPLGRVVNDKKVTDHHAIIPTRSEHNLGEDGRGRAEGLRPRRQALPRDLPSRGGLRAHACRDDRRGARLPHERPPAARGGLEVRLRRGGRGRRSRPTTTRAATSRCRSSSRARRSRRCRSSRCARRRSRRGATPRRRSWPRWRRPARTSRTPSCARR